MKTPKSFLLEAPKSFVPDEPRELEVVRNEPMQFTIPGQVSLPPNLYNELREVMDSGNPSLWWGWFHRRKIESWTKTLSAKVSYVATLATAYEVENKIKVQAFTNHHLMADLQAAHKLHLKQQESQYLEAELAYRLAKLASDQNLPLATYLARLEQEWLHGFTQKKSEDELATKRKDKEENLRIDREDEYDKSLRHIDVTAKAANLQAQLITALHAQVEKKLHELLAIETSEHPDHHKKRLIANKKNEIKRLEVQLERLEEDDRKAAPRPAPKAEAKADSDVRTNFGKVRTIATE